MDYFYTRTYLNNAWNINNLKDVDARNQSVSLVTRIQAALPAFPVKVILDSTQCTVRFENPLSGADYLILNATVALHEAASGTPVNQTAIKMISPDGSLFELTVSDAGDLKVTAAS